MKLHASLLVAVFALFLLPGCGEQDGETGGAAASAKSKVDYQAIFNSIGVLKITHKDNNGQLIVEEAVEAKTPGTKWGKDYEFDGPIDAMITIELADDSPPDPEKRMALTIKIGQGHAFFRIGDDNEMPILQIRRGWRLHRDLDALLNNFTFNRP